MKKLLAFCFAAALFAVSAQAQVGLTGYPANGQLPGTATNDSASAGNVGEYVAAGSTTGAQTVTLTIATPAVVTWGTTSPFQFTGTGCFAVSFSTTGALPTGISAATNYYVISSSVSGNSFQIATSCANAVAGTAVATSGTQSGVQTGTPGALQTTNTAVTFVGVQLGAGDWEIECQGVFRTAASTSVTSLVNTIDAATIINAASYWASAANVPGVVDIGVNVGPYRVSQAAPALHTCVSFPTFTASTLSEWGSIRARRVR